jgi:hypothetical protein
MLLPTLGGAAVGSDAAAGGADRTSAIRRGRAVAAPLSPRGPYSPGRSEPTGPSMKRPGDPPVTALLHRAAHPEATAGSA